jgi:hypothetical protein
VLRALTPEDVLEVTVRNRLHYDHATQKGVVYQMLSAVTECRVGVTAVGDSPREAEVLWQKTRAHLLEEATVAAQDTGLPPADWQHHRRRIRRAAPPKSVIGITVAGRYSDRRRRARPSPK